MNSNDGASLFLIFLHAGSDGMNSALSLMVTRDIKVFMLLPGDIGELGALCSYTHHTI
jgi:hypothetical protein